MTNGGTRGAATLYRNAYVRICQTNCSKRYRTRNLYLVYTETLSTDRSAGTGPRLQRSQRRTVLLKYAYTFNLWGIARPAGSRNGSAPSQKRSFLDIP